jgi:5'-3' exonuclease
MFSHIFKLSKKFDATQVILCVDHKLNWRKKIYPDYKAQRKEAKEKDDIDWEEFYNEFDKFVEQCKNYFPFYVLQSKYMEADDIAAILTKKFQGEKKVIITSDGDYVQLLRYKNIKLFDPIKNKFKESDDPIRALKIKCIMGDRSDNIPAIKPRVGEKTAEKLCDDPILLKEMFEDPELGEEYKENYKRNIRLIDMNRIPDKLVDNLIQQYDTYELPDGKKIFQFLAKNKYRDLMNQINEIEFLCKTLVETANITNSI